MSLPTDETVLNDKWYKLRGYKVGGRVSVVSLNNLEISYPAGNTENVRAPAVPSQSTSLCHGHPFTLFLTPYL